MSTKMEQLFGGKTEQDILAFFLEKDIHCVKCKAAFPEDPDIVYPVNNSLSITVGKADGTRIHGVPYLTCPECDYNTSVHKIVNHQI